MKKHPAAKPAPTTGPLPELSFSFRDGVWLATPKPVKK